MELPINLKNLYRHWKFHTDPIVTNRSTSTPSIKFKDKKLIQNISWFITERMNIWRKKTLDTRAKGSILHRESFTEDSILSTYRFCNIFREFDRQTIEFHTLLNPLRDDFPLWLLNMFYFRMVARTETIKTVGLLSFDAVENKKFYKKLMDSSRPRFGTPYVFPVSTIQRSTTPTRELFIATYLPSIMKVIAKEISTWKRKSVYEGVESILPIFKYNHRFLWTEVLIDVAYQFPEYVDLYGRFPIGPGSLPTMKKIGEAILDSRATKGARGSQDKNDPSLLVQDLCWLDISTTATGGLTYNNKPLRLSAENWEGIGCEYRKYTNLKNGKGRRRIYH
jgi:hypothetical protein